MTTKMPGPQAMVTNSTDCTRVLLWYTISNNHVRVGSSGPCIRNLVHMKFNDLLAAGHPSHPCSRNVPFPVPVRD